MSIRRSLFESTLALLLLACSERSASLTNTAGTGGSAGDTAFSAGGAGEIAGASGDIVAGAAGEGGSANVSAAGSGAECEPAAPPNAWASWPLPDPTSFGQATSQRYTETSVDVVTDDVTQLTWQRRLSDGTYTWHDARSYCDCLTLGGYDDWQLPSRVELVSIVDFTRQDPALDPVAFPSTPFEWFWSASAVAGAGEQGLAWYVAFWDGNTHTGTTDSNYRVRCVRRAERSPHQYSIPGDGTVADARTGLTWQQGMSNTQLAWTDAKQYCSQLVLAGGGFRLPNMKELQSLVDESVTDPAIDGASFPQTPSEGFWAVNPLADTPTAAWFVNFGDGISYNSLIERTYRARCVR